MSETPTELEGIQEGRGLLEDAQARLRMLMIVAETLSERFRAGEDIATRDIVSVALETSKARRTVSDELDRHERRELERLGVLKSSEIDFDAVRAKVWCQLDRIRNARDAGGVSGGSG